MPVDKRAFGLQPPGGFVAAAVEVPMTIPIVLVATGDELMAAPVVSVLVVSTVVVLDEASVSAAARWTLTTIAAVASSAMVLITANAIRLVFIGVGCYLS
jgi:hypothetical protein